MQNLSKKKTNSNNNKKKKKNYNYRYRIMIPKIIHYCWFGGNPLPEKAKECIESWKKYFPDYEIKEWNESNFDVMSIPYTQEAYRLKKYAFVSDYARLWVLYNYGGIYFDTDVEVIASFDDIIAQGSFMGLEYAKPSNEKITSQGASTNYICAPGLCMGCPPKSELIKKALDWYQHNHYTSWTGVYTGTICKIVTQFLNKETDEVVNGIIKKGEFYLYEPQYFCPKNFLTGEVNITEKTRSIHHYDSTWVTPKKTIFDEIKKRCSNISARLHCFIFNSK